MLAASIVDHQLAASPLVRDAALRNVAFFGTAERLLGGKGEIPR
jgi:hypothetical protein